MFQRKALNLDFNESTKVLDLREEYKKILQKIETLNSDPNISKRMDKIMEINRIVSDRINTFNLEDSVDARAYRYYAKMVRDTCEALLVAHSDKDFNLYYKRAKNVLS